MYNFLSTVYADVVEKGMILTAGQAVQLIGLGQKMSVAGFVPCDFYVDSILSELALSNNTLKIAENVIISNIKNYPENYIVTRTVCKILEEKILLDKYIDIPKYSCNGNKYIAERFINMRIGLIKNTITQDNWSRLKMTKDFECKESSVFYTPDKDELVFTKDNNRRVSIARYFLCLCIYNNPIGGRIEYQLFNPKELVRIDSL